MFKTMRRQLDRPQPTGKALVIRRIIIASIFIATFFAFQMIQLGKVDTALYGQSLQIEQATSASKENADGILKQFATKFPGAEQKLFTDHAFSESPLSDRLPNGIKFETDEAQREAIKARSGVVLFDIFQFVLPGAVNMVQSHDQKLADFFNSDAYKSSVASNAKALDLNAAVQYCQGTPLSMDKSPDGYAEGGGKYLSADERTKRANAINEAADRTICADIPKIKK